MPCHEPQNISCVRYNVHPLPKNTLIEDLTEGKYILYRDNHFVGLRCYADGECVLSRDHRTCNNIACDVADLRSDRFESIFHLTREVLGLHSIETESLLLEIHALIRIRSSKLWFYAFARNQTYDSQGVGDDCGGKQMEVCAAEATQQLLRSGAMIQPMFENLLGPHVTDIDPVTRTTQHDVKTNAREVDSDSDESGFWKVSPGWYQRAVDRLGGSTPVDAAQRKRMERSRLEAYAKKARCLASLTSALPQRLVPFTPVFPDSPLRYSPSASDNVDVLKYFHPHVRDMRVFFEPDSHTYYVGGKPTNGSVTGMIHFFCKEFDAEAIIQSMMSGYRWPREGYLR